VAAVRMIYVLDWRSFAVNVQRHQRRPYCNVIVVVAARITAVKISWRHCDQLSAPHVAAVAYPCLLHTTKPVYRVICWPKVDTFSDTIPWGQSVDRWGRPYQTWCGPTTNLCFRSSYPMKT